MGWPQAVASNGSARLAMGRVLCKKHGMTFTTFACQHVIDAITDNHYCAGIEQRSHAVADLPEFEISCWYCPYCIERYQIPPSGSVTEEEASRLLNEPALKGVTCAECFAEWKAWQPVQN
jgi:hypothetical protein